MKESDIAIFQARLLELLASDKSIEDIYSALSSDKDIAGFTEHISNWKPEMIEVAAQLTKKWGVRKSEAN